MGQFPVRGGEAYLTEADPLLRWSVPRRRGLSHRSHRARVRRRVSSLQAGMKLRCGTTAVTTRSQFPAGGGEAQPNDAAQESIESVPRARG